MKINEIARRNDGNYVTEDGTQYVMCYLNPAYGEEGEPEYIKKVIPIDGTEGWVAEYQDAQHKWATADERETDERVDVSRIPVESGEDPMQVLLSLMEDTTHRPEVALGLIEKNESLGIQQMIELLIEFEKKLKPDWKELLDKMYGEQMRISDVIREDLANTGTAKKNQAYSKQHMKAIEKLKCCFEEAGYEVDRTPKRQRK